MNAQEYFQHNPADSLSVINACNALTAQYRSILRELGQTNQLSENAMLVLVHMASYPEANTQKKLQGTNLDLSLSSICRMVESLRQKEYLSTQLDMNDRRSWILHLEERGKALTDAFFLRLGQRLDEIMEKVPGFDTKTFVFMLSRVGMAANLRDKS